MDNKKIKHGNDLLGQAVKKEKEEQLNQNKSATKKNQFVIQNTLGGESKDLFSSSVPQGSRKVNFSTKTYQPPPMASRTIDFGPKKEENTQQKPQIIQPQQNQMQQQQNQQEKRKEQLHNNFFGVPQNDVQSQSSSKILTMKNTAASNGQIEFDKNTLNPSQAAESKTQIRSANNLSPSNSNSNNSSAVADKSDNLSQVRMTATSEDITRDDSNPKQTLVNLGLAKDDYVDGEQHIYHSQVQLKLMYQDTDKPFYKFYDGYLILTTHMVRFVPLEDRKKEILKNVNKLSYYHIPVGMVAKLNRTADKKGIQYSYIEIQSKDFREVVVRFQAIQKDDSEKFYGILIRQAFPGDITKSFAFQYNKFNRHLEEQQRGWDIFDWDKDFERMGVEVAPIENNQDGLKQLTSKEKYYEFRKVDNTNGQFCGTYPPYIYVPFSQVDESLQKVAKFRSRERLPVLSYAIKNPYRNKSNKYISLWRCAQCKVGVSKDRSYEDELYLKVIGDNQNTTQNAYNCHIYDARPKINAVGMQLAGKGYEHIEFYNNCDITFLNIGNIHKVRDAQKGLIKATSSESKCFGYIDKSGYFEIISYILEGAVKIKQTLEKGINVVIHCSDGWDRTAQLSALVQILIDPYYRTIKGFQALIEKEWIQFGHQFLVRSGHTNKNASDEQRSPVFSQFLDCVHQIMNQYPLSFEFNYRFLSDINFHVYSCQFGTFLCNSYQEQKYYNIWNKTVSLWSYMNQSEKRDRYLNSFLIDDGMQIQNLEPDSSLMSMRLFKEVFLYHSQLCKDRYRIYMDMTFNEDNMQFMHRMAKYKNKQLQELLNNQEDKYKDVIDQYNEKLKAREDIIAQYEKAYGGLPTTNNPIIPQQNNNSNDNTNHQENNQNQEENLASQQEEQDQQEQQEKEIENQE